MLLAHELDLVHDHLKLGSALAVLVPARIAQLALDGHLHALVQDAAHALGAVAEHRAVHEVRVVLPLAGLLVAAAVVDGHAKVQNLHAALGSPQLGVAGQVPADVHSVDRHLVTPFAGPVRPGALYVLVDGSDLELVHVYRLLARLVERFGAVPALLQLGYVIPASAEVAYHRHRRSLGSLLKDRDAQRLAVLGLVLGVLASAVAQRLKLVHEPVEELHALGVEVLHGLHDLPCGGRAAPWVGLELLVLLAALEDVGGAAALALGDELAELWRLLLGGLLGSHERVGV